MFIRMKNSPVLFTEFLQPLVQGQDHSMWNLSFRTEMICLNRECLSGYQWILEKLKHLLYLQILYLFRKVQIQGLYMLKGQNVAQRIEVTIGKRFDDQLEIISDNLKEGDNLVTEGQSRLINGDKIEIVM